MIRRSGLLFLGLMLVFVLPLRAETVTGFILGNGLEVVVIEDRRAPVVVHMVWYRVGAADEPPGKSGIAHFLEHLMFKGTERLAAGEFSRVVKENGGSDNAFTSWDYTAYFQRIAADRLGLVMEMEADRMRNLRMSAEDVRTERLVILEERSQRIDSDPAAQFGEQRRAALYLNHPYGIPIIGWRHEMEGLTRQDALDFYALHYAPDNAILIVAGDVTPDSVRALAETHYGPIPAGQDRSARMRPQEPPHLSERRMTLADHRIGQPYVVRTYLAQPRRSADQAEAAALAVLAEVLGGDTATSVMGQALQFDSQTAIYTSAFYSDVALDETSFGLVVVPAEGVSLDTAEQAMDEVIARFIAEGVDPEQFARIKARMRAEEIYDRDNTQRLGQRYGAALTSGLVVEDVLGWPAAIEAVTEDDVIAAARAVFDRRRAVTGYLERPAPQEPTQ